MEKSWILKLGHRPTCGDVSRTECSPKSLSPLTLGFWHGPRLAQKMDLESGSHGAFLWGRRTPHLPSATFSPFPFPQKLQMLPEMLFCWIQAMTLTSSPSVPSKSFCFMINFPLSGLWTSWSIVETSQESYLGLMNNFFFAVKVDISWCVQMFAEIPYLLGFNTFSLFHFIYFVSPIFCLFYAVGGRKDSFCLPRQVAQCSQWDVCSFEIMQGRGMTFAFACESECGCHSSVACAFQQWGHSPSFMPIADSFITFCQGFQ